MSKLSFSAANKYLQCAKSYKYHYVDRLRERTATSYLALGSAIDASLNAVLVAHQNKTLDKLDYTKIFDENWEVIKINDVEHRLAFCELVGYAAKDFMVELLTDEDINNLKHAAAARDVELDLTTDGIQALRDAIETEKSQRQYKHFNSKRHQILNYMNYMSLRRKAHLMLDAYVRDIIPKIEEVISVQEKVELGSAEDSFVGYIDAVVKLKGYPDPIVLDNKTSASPYEEDKVVISPQLATYCYGLDVKHAAFAVMLKGIKLNAKKTCSVCGHKGEGSHKTCDNDVKQTNDKGKEKMVRCNSSWITVYEPSAVTQLLVDKVPQQFQDVVIDNYGEITDAIKANIFPRNLNACHNMFGQKCPYLDHCLAGKSDNLVKLDAK